MATPFYPLSDEVDCEDCTAERKDGYLDLTLKFDAQEGIGAVIERFGEVGHKDCVVLSISGYLLDGTPIEGVDVVSIRVE